MTYTTNPAAVGLRVTPKEEDPAQGMGVQVCADDSCPAAGADLTGVLGSDREEGRESRSARAALGSQASVSEDSASAPVSAAGEPSATQDERRQGSGKAVPPSAATDAALSAAPHDRPPGSHTSGEPLPTSPSAAEGGSLNGSGSRGPGGPEPTTE